jgi:amidase
MRSSRSIAVLSGLSIAFACGPSFGGSLQYPFVRLETRRSCSSGSEPQKPMMTCSSFDLLTVTGAHLQQLFQDGETSSLQVVEACMDQIGTHNKAGLNLRAILSLAPSENVFEKATVLDEERKIGKVRSQLHGIPIILKAKHNLSTANLTRLTYLKDCIATDPSMKMNTTAGCWALATPRPSKSTPVVDRVSEL